MIPKFRAWNKATKEMHEADDIVSLNFEEKQICVQTIFFGQLSYYDFDDIVSIQSTGLKDKNGKEIFEGDILSDEGSELEDEWVYVSVINKDGMYYCLENEIHGVSGALIDFVPYYSVVGNIYENPELLK